MPAKKESCDTGYCVSCKAKRGMKNCKKTVSNGRHVLKGECIKCGTKMNKFIAAPK
jgi:hypothetical protein